MLLLLLTMSFERPLKYNYVELLNKHTSEQPNLVLKSSLEYPLLLTPSLLLIKQLRRNNNVHFLKILLLQNYNAHMLLLLLQDYYFFLYLNYFDYYSIFFNY